MGKRNVKGVLVVTDHWMILLAGATLDTSLRRVNAAVTPNGIRWTWPS